MSYLFLFGLLLSILIAILLYYLLIRRLEINWRHQNNHAPSFFLPVLMAILLVAHISFDLRNRCLDLLDFWQNTSAVEVVSTEQIDLDEHIISISDTEILFHESDLTVLDDAFYRVTYAKRSRVVLKIEAVQEN